MLYKAELIHCRALGRHVGSSNEPARKEAGFDIDAYIACGQFGMIAGAPINLRAVFTRAAGVHLFETPLSVDQVLSTTADGRLQPDATVSNTRALVWWLLGFEDSVVVHEPALREGLAGIAARMAISYAWLVGLIQLTYTKNPKIQLCRLLLLKQTKLSGKSVGYFRKSLRSMISGNIRRTSITY